MAHSNRRKVLREDSPNTMRDRASFVLFFVANFAFQLLFYLMVCRSMLHVSLSEIFVSDLIYFILYVSSFLLFLPVLLIGFTLAVSRFLHWKTLQAFLILIESLFFFYLICDYFLYRALAIHLSDHAVIVALKTPAMMKHDVQLGLLTWLCLAGGFVAILLAEFALLAKVRRWVAPRYTSEKLAKMPAAYFMRLLVCGVSLACFSIFVETNAGSGTDYWGRLPVFPAFQ